MPDVQDYLRLASEAHDFAACAPDPGLAASYRRLAGSYHALARFRDQISAGGGCESRDTPQVFGHGAPDAARIAMAAAGPAQTGRSFGRRAKANGQRCAPPMV
jgi:hypothetical protein